jgi:hypothetical protein
VRALVRPDSDRRLPDGALPVMGDALRAETFAGAAGPSDTLIHLVGTYLLLPIYAVLGRLPPTRESARRLGVVTHEQMLR